MIKSLYIRYASHATIKVYEDDSMCSPYESITAPDIVVVNRPLTQDRRYTPTNSSKARILRFYGSMDRKKFSKFALIEQVGAIIIITRKEG